MTLSTSANGMTRRERNNIRLVGQIKRVGNCRNCEMSQHRRFICHGNGDPDAVLMVIYSNPNWYQDIAGNMVPDVDNRGQEIGGSNFLVKGIASIGLSPQDVFVTSVAMCGPTPKEGPKKMRLPLSAEAVAACKPNLMEKIRIVNPAVIMCLGRAASANFIDDKRPLVAYNGHFRSFKAPGCKPTGSSAAMGQLIVSTHTPYALTFPDREKETEEFFNTWTETAYRIHGMARAYKPDAALFSRGWSWGTGLGKLS